MHQYPWGLHASSRATCARMVAGLLLLCAADAVAYPNNNSCGTISGYSGREGSTCSDCHGGGPYSYTAGITLSKVARSSTTVFSIVGTKSGGATANGAGFNLAIAGSAGTLNDIGSTVEPVGSEELAHDFPLSPNASGNFSWSASWTAPATSGSHTFYHCVNIVNGNRNGDCATGMSGDNPVCGTTTVTVNAPPVVSGVDAAPSYTEDGPSVVLDSSITISDTDDTQLQSATVTISTGYQSGADQLVCPSTTLTCSFNGSTGVLTLSGVAWESTYDSALQGVRFQNTSDNPSTTTRTIGFRIRDAFGEFSATDSLNLSVVAVNDAPSLNNSVGQINTYTENGPAVIVDTTVTVSDVDSSSLNQATVAITGNYQSGADQLVCPNPAIIGISCSFSAATATLTLSGTASLANYELALEDVGFQNTSDDPSTATRTITFQIRDTANATSAVDSTFFNVAAVNDAPNATNDSAGVAKNSSDNVLDVLVNDTDVDAGDTKQVIEVDGSTAFPVKTTNGSVSLSAATTGNQLLYTPDLNYSGPDSFTYTMRDAAGLTSSATVDVTVSAGSPPVAMDDAVTMDEDSSQAIAVLANDTDSDAGDTLSVTHINGSTATTVPTTHGSVTRSGNTVTYTPTANYAGADSFTYTVTDTSNLTGIGTVNITVSNVADAPTLASPIPDQAATEDTSFSFTFAAGTFSNVDAGDSLTYQAALSSGSPLPAWLSFAGDTRTFSGTPANGNVGNISVRVTATDSTSLTATDDFSITVTNVNDPPVIDTSVLPGPALDGQAYTATIEAMDPDVGDSLAFNLTQGPAGMTLSTSGILDWTPPCATADQVAGYSVDVGLQVEDESAASDARTYSLAVDVPDSDGDGMPDCYELANAFNPADPADGAADRDGDGRTNAEEFLAGSAPDVDDVPPLVVAPSDLVIPATGYVTEVSLGKATAKDFKSGETAAVTATDPALLRPGRHSIEWTATDAEGNVGTATQTIDVLPLANFNLSQAAPEGSSVVVTVSLSGPPPEYPATINYFLEGSASADDASLAGVAVADGSIVISSGFSGSISLDLVDDGLPEGDETLALVMTDAAQATPGSRKTHVVTIAENNVAPLVLVQAQQDGEPRLTVYRDGGMVTVTGLAFDANSDALAYDWSGTDAALNPDLTPAATSFSFDPSAVSAGAYRIHVRVSDGTAAGEASVHIAVREAGPVLGSADADGDGVSDADEGLADLDGDGLPAYLDAIAGQALLPDQTGDLARLRHLETHPQLSLRLGSIALAAGRGGALINPADLLLYSGAANTTDSYDHTGGLFDFEVHGLEPGATADVVLPLQTTIRPGAVYRKFDALDGWSAFVVDGRNALASARAVDGHCPGPASTAWASGLGLFHECLRLTLEDGGPNDADGLANGVIRDPGSLGVPALADGDSKQRRGSGGTLALAWLTLAGLAALGAAWRRTRRAWR